MIEIYPNLFVGSQPDYEHLVKDAPGWSVVQACKEPYHREALGYKGRSVESSHPEYLIARRGHRLILNLVDVNDPAYISREIVDAALLFIDNALLVHLRVLVHCNQGRSRSAGLGLLWLASRTDVLPASFEEAEAAYLLLYPDYRPADGIRGFIQANWQVYHRAVPHVG